MTRQRGGTVRHVKRYIKSQLHRRGCEALQRHKGELIRRHLGNTLLPAAWRPRYKSNNQMIKEEWQRLKHDLNRNKLGKLKTLGKLLMKN